MSTSRLNALRAFRLRVPASFVLALTLCAGAWAGGGAETATPEIFPRVTGKNGVTEISFSLGKIEAAVLKTTRNGVTTYSVPIENEERDVEAAKALTLADPSFAPTKSKDQPRWDLSWIDTQERREGPVRSHWSGLDVKSSSPALIRIEDYGVDTTYELTWIGSKKLQRLIVKGTPEFVRGERVLFKPSNGVFGSGKTYDHKALSLLATLFPDGKLEGYLEANLPANAGILPLTKLDRNKMNETTRAAFDKAYEGLKGAIGAQFMKNTGPSEGDDDPLEFPTTTMDANGFRQLYGELGKGRNPYLLGYLLYSYAKNKPLLSYPAQVKLGKRSSPIPYDWAKYRELNTAEGRALAKSALRYLVGAVEYSQHTAAKDERMSGNRTGGEDRSVYAANRVRIDNWLSGGSAGGSRDENYLADGFAATAASGADSIGPAWIVNQVTTPFVDKNGKRIYGDPLPYAPYGMDTPRSFAYKLTEQLKARQWVTSKDRLKNVGDALLGITSTKANVSYVDYAKANSVYYKRDFPVNNAKDYKLPPDVLKLSSAEGPYKAGESVKPYLPGAYNASLPENKVSPTSYYGPDMTAGVDSAGLLVGALSMTSLLDGVADGSNRRIGKVADAYNRFDASAKSVAAYRVDTADTLAVRGLDASGKPAYYTKDDGSRRDTIRANLTWSDLERMTVLVPDISLIRMGDLIAGRDGVGRPHIGVVVGLGWSTGPAFGTDPAAWWSKVNVVSVRSGLRVANLGTWGNPGGTFGGFTMNPEVYQIRRLVTYDASRPPADGEKESWEAMDGYAKSVTWTITSWEADTKPEPADASQSWPWIPNTGEPLYLTIRGSGKTIYSDKDEGAFAGKRIELTAKDWGAEAGHADDGSNIIFNKGSGFDFGYVKTEKGKTNLVSLVKFPRDTPPVKSDEYASGAYKLTTKTDGRLVFGKLNKEGNLETEYTQFWVRPLDEKAKPGDDWELGFKVQDNEDIAATLVGAKRLAIYDKKLLWRANLYLAEEGAGTAGSKDWNDIHPWNAPPDEIAEIAMRGSGELPFWWKSAWGYNEWNRKWDGTGDKANDFKGLKELPPGNGNQVAKFLPITPVRLLHEGAKGSETMGIKNTLSNTVSYSYPKHSYEPGPWSGASGSMDSPFDYIKKMLRQRVLLKNWYNTDGKKFRTSKNTWPSSAQSDTNKFSTLADFRMYVWNMTDAEFNAISVEGSNWKNHALITSFSLKSWDSNWEVPDRNWWRHIVDKPAEGWTSATNYPELKSFVPGLGLRVSSNRLENKLPKDVVPDSVLDKAWVIEAGTDCVGFAQRAAGYKDSNYNWAKLPFGWTEMADFVGSDDIWEQLRSYNKDGRYRSYPRPQTEKTGTTIVHNSLNEGNGDGYYQTKKVGGDELTAREKQDLLLALRRIIPGDIWMKDSPDSVENDPANTLWDNHIAIVTFVPSDPAITEPQVFMDQMLLIEGEFTNKMQSVIKKLSVGDYNSNNVSENKLIYPNFALTVDTLSPSGLNCQSWAIRRLK